MSRIWSDYDINEFNLMTDAFQRGEFLKAFLESVALPAAVRCQLCPKPSDLSGTYLYCKFCCNTKRAPVPFSEVWCK
jgi:hypothetical protein